MRSNAPRGNQPECADETREVQSSITLEIYELIKSYLQHGTLTQAPHKIQNLNSKERAQARPHLTRAKRIELRVTQSHREARIGRPGLTVSQDGGMG